MANEYTESLDTILKDTIPQLPGAVRAVAERELRMAIREFFERSFAWREVVGPINAPAGDTAVLLDETTTGDTNADVIGVLRLRFNGNDLGPLPFKPGHVTNTSDVPTGYYMTSNPDEFKLYPFLENPQTGALEAIVAKTPQLDATVFPRQLQSKFYDALVEGFLARMYAHPNKPYSAPLVAQQMRHNFRRRIGYYMAQAKQGYNDAQAWRYPQGWSPRSVRRYNG